MPKKEARTDSSYIWGLSKLTTIHESNVMNIARKHRVHSVDLDPHTRPSGMRLEVGTHTERERESERERAVLI